VKRRKKRGVYFLNRPAPTERTWLLEHGASEEDLAFPDPSTDPLAGLFPDPALRERFGFLIQKLRAATGRSLLFDDARGVAYRAFLGVGPADRAGDHPEGLILVRGPDPRARIPGLADDAPGARDLVAFYRGGLGALAGGDDLLGLALPPEVLAWSKARKHDMGQIDFLPEHRTRNLRIFWDRGDGGETLFDAAGRVYAYLSGQRLEFRYEALMRELEEVAVRIASGRGWGPLFPEDVEAAAPGHFLGPLLRFRGRSPEEIDPAEVRAAIRHAEGAGVTREELADLHLLALAREERWDEYAQEMRRLALGPTRSVVGEPRYWRWLARAAEARARPSEFREIAIAAAQGPLVPQSRGLICDLLIDAGDIEAAIAVLERWMRPGQTPDPELARRAERIRALRPGRR
jgi:hypothetical protein